MTRPLDLEEPPVLTADGAWAGPSYPSSTVIKLMSGAWLSLENMVTPMPNDSRGPFSWTMRTCGSRVRHRCHLCQWLPKDGDTEEKKQLPRSQRGHSGSKRHVHDVSRG